MSSSSSEEAIVHEDKADETAVGLPSGQSLGAGFPPSNDRSCVTKGCRNNNVYACQGPNCNSFMCLPCHEAYIANPKRGSGVCKLTNVKGAVVIHHSKKCFEKLSSLLQRIETNSLLWSEDAGSPTNDNPNPKCSEQVLIQWLSQEGNYRKFRNGGDGRWSKTTLAQQISDIIKDSGCICPRSPKAILMKIQKMEAQFAKTFAWTQQTGVGVKETDPAGFQATVLKQCPFFHELEPVLRDRAKNKPIATSDTVRDVAKALFHAPPSSSDSENTNEDVLTMGSDLIVDKTPTQTLEHKTPRSNNSRRKTSSVGSSSSKKVQGWRAKRSLSPMEAFDDIQREQVQEMKRRNQKMEIIEERKIALEEKKYLAAEKLHEVEKETALLKLYMQLKDSGKSDSFISIRFPHLAHFCEDIHDV